MNATTKKHRWQESKTGPWTTCRDCGADQHVVGPESACEIARHSDPEIDALYRERRKACEMADRDGRGAARGWQESERISAKLRRLDPFGPWYFEGNHWDGQGWRVEIPEWGVLVDSKHEGRMISRAEDYGQAEHDAALSNAACYGSALVVRNYDPGDGAGSRLVVWHAQTGEWSPLAEALS